jgi:hypothetical protein
MALMSSVLMFAGNPQTFVGIASAQQSFFLLSDILPAYVSYVRRDLEQTLIGPLVFHGKALYKILSCLSKTKGVQLFSRSSETSSPQHWMRQRQIPLLLQRDPRLKAAAHYASEWTGRCRRPHLRSDVQGKLMY